MSGVESPGTVSDPGGHQCGSQRCGDRGRHRLASDRPAYDHLLALAPGPIVALNRAVAVAEAGGVDTALTIVESLRSDDMERYHLFHAIRADLLERTGRTTQAAEALAAAIERTGNARERDFLEKILARLRTGSAGYSMYGYD